MLRLMAAVLDLPRPRGYRSLQMRLPIDVSKLSTAEKLDLLHELWESLPKAVSSPPVTPAVKRLLDARLADLEARPADESSWSAVRTRVFGRRKRR